MIVTKKKKRDILDVGLLDTRITFQRKVRVDTEGGGWYNNWTDYQSVWAQKRDISGNVEKNTNEHSENEIDVEYTVRYDSQLDTSMRIIDNTVPFRIREIKNVGHQNRWLVIRASGNLWEKTT